MTMSKQIYLRKLLKVLFVTIMLALESNNYWASTDGDSTVPTTSSIIAPDGCPGRWIDMCLNNAPVRYIFEFVFFQYGKTVRMKYGFEGTYGISNGIAWTPKFLAFNKYFKMALGDFSINLVNIVFDAIRILPLNIFDDRNYFITLLYFNIFINFHLLAFKFAQFLKLKLLSPIGIFFALESHGHSTCEFIGDTIDVMWFFTDDKKYKMSMLFIILSPRLTFDISEFISFISADKS